MMWTCLQQKMMVCGCADNDGVQTLMVCSCAVSSCMQCGVGMHVLALGAYQRLGERRP